MITRNFDNVLVGIALALRRDGKILLHKRKGMHSPGSWAHPGGHIEKWETPEQCALRELAEECGPQVKVTYPRFWNYQNTMFKNEDKHYILLSFVSDWISGEPVVTEPDKCECWEWFSWDNLPSPLMLGIQQMKDTGLNPFTF